VRQCNFSQSGQIGEKLPSIREICARYQATSMAAASYSAENRAGKSPREAAMAIDQKLSIAASQQVM